MSWRGVLTGALALIAHEALVRTPASADRFGGIFTGIASLVERIMSPAVAAIPDLSGSLLETDGGTGQWGHKDPSTGQWLPGPPTT